MFQLPELPYDFDALEPVVAEEIMKLHYTKHHQGYTNKLNNAVQGTEYADMEIEEVLSQVSQLPEDIKTAVRNNGGGYYNHSVFWDVMSPEGGEPTESVRERISQDFGDFDRFKSAFTNAAGGVFGSGWAWLVLQPSGTLAVTTTPNQDNPLMDVDTVDVKGTPVLGIDVWEHAYYLQYKNERGSYVDEWWNVVNWQAVEERITG